jgi:hypothetical protein
MPHYQDPGHNGQHAFTAFIHCCSLFVRFTLAPHFAPAQYLKTSPQRSRIAGGGHAGRSEAEEIGGGGNGDDAPAAAAGFKPTMMRRITPEGCDDPWIRNRRLVKTTSTVLDWNGFPDGCVGFRKPLSRHPNSAVSRPTLRIPTTKSSQRVIQRSRKPSLHRRPQDRIFGRDSL